MRLGWLVVVAASMLQGACITQLPSCHDPGSKFAASCYYKVRITGVENDATGLVTGENDKEAVMQNSTRWGSFWPLGPDFDFDEYDKKKAVFTFGVKDWANKTSDKTGQSFDFCSVPHSRYLRPVPAPKDGSDPCA